MKLPFIETMITQACNLSCLGCTNYSDLRHRGYVPWQQGRRDLMAWRDRLEIEDFGIMGGEPLINPGWRDWIRGVRDLLPAAQIRFTTNGLLLDRAPDILEICEEVGNIVFKISVHVQNDQLEKTIQSLKDARDWQPVVEYGIHRWCGPNGMKFQINRPARFLKTYRNDYANMAPWHSDPSQAFAVCCQQTCPLLYQARIYKCSTSALLQDTLAKFGNPNPEQWQGFIPRGISATDPDDVIQEFCDNFGQPHAICGQCPSDTTTALDHQSTVVFKRRTHAGV